MMNTDVIPSRGGLQLGVDPPNPKLGEVINISLQIGPATQPADPVIGPFRQVGVALIHRHGKDVELLGPSQVEMLLPAQGAISSTVFGLKAKEVGDYEFEFWVYWLPTYGRLEERKINIRVE